MSGTYDDDFFPHPADNDHPSRILYREEYIRKFSALFRDDPDWTSKLDDPAYFFQKLKEAQELDRFIVDLNQAVDVWSPEDAEFVWRELVERYRPFVVERRGEGGKGVEPSIDGVWKKDDLVDEELRKTLLEAVKLPEATTDGGELWRNSGCDSIGIHPSDWPIVYGRTTSSDGTVIEPPPGPEPPGRPTGLAQYHDPQIKKPISKRFCWLPSEFEVAEDGKVKIASYINNLATEEQQKVFYPIIEKIFEGLVPLFNHVLADLREEKSKFRRAVRDSQTVSQVTGGQPRDGAVVEGEDVKDKPEVAADKSPLIEEQKPTGDWETFSENFNFDRFRPTAWGVNPKSIFEIDPADRLGKMWTPPKPETLEKVKLEGSTAKVIVKTMHIALSPDRPWYTGGEWRVEGTKNERIIASGVYCYQQENVTEFGLNFRRGFSASSEEKGFFGLQSYDTCQDIGNVETRVNRGVVFPNIYHHRGWACCLLDDTKPGYIKLLVFLLCDPSEDSILPTTRTVPAQQPHIREERINAFRRACAGRLPAELLYEIEDFIPPSISRAEASDYRKELGIEGLEWTESIQKYGGDAARYFRSKPIEGKSIDIISGASTYEWRWFTTR
ncbi:hypothetical protein TWF281_000265 [Arthrobotrys megalospora]